jgi:hypothetical protein
MRFYATLGGFLLALLLVQWPAVAQAQPAATLTGIARDRATQEPLIGASISLENTKLGAATDVEGRFRLTNIPPGNYNIRVQAVGYEPLTRFNVALTSGNAATLVLEVNASSQQLGEAVVTASRAIRVATAETPLSVQRLSSEEILTNPGGNFDISRTLQRTCITSTVSRCPSSTTSPRKGRRAARRGF